MKRKISVVVFMESFLINTTLVFAVFQFSNLYGQGKSINLEIKDKPLEFVLLEIKKQTGMSFVYNDELISGKKVSCSFRNTAAEAALQTVLKESDIHYKIFDKNSIVLYEGEKPGLKNNSVVIVNKDFADKDTKGIRFKPILLSTNKPVYPPEAVRNKVEGNVRVLFQINEKGNVTDAIVKSSSGSPLLDSSAVEYTKTLKYIPAQNDGEPQSVWITMIFKYFFEGD